MPRITQNAREGGRKSTVKIAAPKKQSVKVKKSEVKNANKKRTGTSKKRG